MINKTKINKTISINNLVCQKYPRSISSLQIISRKGQIYPQYIKWLLFPCLYITSEGCFVVGVVVTLLSFYWLHSRGSTRQQQGYGGLEQNTRDSLRAIVAWGLVAYMHRSYLTILCVRLPCKFLLSPHIHIYLCMKRGADASYLFFLFALSANSLADNIKVCRMVNTCELGLEEYLTTQVRDNCNF